jgi:transcriptional regulator with XRE-family HTH domain
MVPSPKSPAPPPFDCDPRLLRVGVLARQLALGLSQQDIADQTRLSEARISRFMSGREQPSDQTVNRLAHWLRMPLEHFQAEPRTAVPAA